MASNGSSVDFALEILMREMELVIRGGEQLRAGVAATLGFILTIDALLIANALDRSIPLWKFSAGAVATIVLIILAARTLFPTRHAAWPDGSALVEHSAGTVIDEKRCLVFRYRDYLVEARSKVETTVHLAATTVLLGCVTVGIWTWLYVTLPAKG